MAKPPEYKARWCYALEEKWQSFSDGDDARLEEKWLALQKSGELSKRREELKQERKRKNLDDEASQKAKGEQEKGTMASSDVHDLNGAPSGVDMVRTGLMDAIGKGKISKDEANANEEQERRDNIAKEQLDPDQPESERTFRVEVMEDHLFEVDISTMRLFPVFWKGVMLKVVRATWFYSSDSDGHAPIPYDDDLTGDLDATYEEAKPWIHLSLIDGATKEKTYKLPSMDSHGEICFEDAFSGHIFTHDLTGKLRSVMGGSLVIRGWTETLNRSKTSSSFFEQSNLPWATGKETTGDAIERSDDNVQSRSGAAQAPRKAPATSTSSGQNKDSKSEGGLFSLWPSSDGVLRPGVNLLRAIGWSKNDANEEEQRASKQKTTEKSLEQEKDREQDDDTDAEDNVSDDRKDEPPELILIIHGIGQKMVEEWASLDFELDVERFRNVSKKVASTRALKKVSRGKRAQYLPICWRKEINFDQTEVPEGNDNVYTLEDVSNGASIPLVRNVISKVIVDVPYYLSRHKSKMIEAVKAELNRVYRLFVRRNPDFERKGGRVSLICHSLGSAIAADILSQQPTVVPSLDEQTRDDLTSNEHLLFNVKNLIFVGSPNGFFFHLEGAQMIARRGTARTRDVAEDAAKDVVGKYGCMAAESIYNCYNTTDPVAFQLSPTVDAQYARTLNPISMPDAVPALLEALQKPRLSLSKLFDPKHPFSREGNPAYVLEPKIHTPVASPPESGTNTPKRRIKGEKKTSIMIEEGSAQKEAQIKAQLEKSKGDNELAEKIKSKDIFDLDRLERAERR